jgi:hypothetical protein
VLLLVLLAAHGATTLKLQVSMCCWQVSFW